MLKWAQRRDKLFITLDAQDITGEVVSLSPEALRFSGDGGSGKRYELLLNFYKPVDPQHPESKWVSTGRDFRLTIKKVDEADEHWPRLIAETGKLERIQVDWSRYVDEDEEDQIDFSELGGGVDFSGFGVGATDGVGNEDEGPGGVGGDEDDEMPDLMPASASDGPEPEPEPE